MSQVQSEYTQKQGRSFPIIAQTLRLWVKHDWMSDPLPTTDSSPHGLSHPGEMHLPALSLLPTPPHCQEHSITEGREARGAPCNCEILEKLQWKWQQLICEASHISPMSQAVKTHSQEEWIQPLARDCIWRQENLDSCLVSWRRTTFFFQKSFLYCMHTQYAELLAHWPKR